MNDKTLINKLWWLNKALTDHFSDKDYKEIYDKELSEDVAKELDDLVEHIKLTY